MKITLRLPLFISLIALCSCLHQYGGKQIAEVEKVIECAPDSALAILDDMEFDSITDAAMRHKFRLLKLQSLIKLDRFDYSDSSYSKDLEYFTANGNNVDRIKATFYKAYIKFINQDYVNELVDLDMALRLAEGANDTYWLAKTHELAADTYHNNGYRDRAIHHALEAIRFFRSSGKTVSVPYIYCDLAGTYSENGNTDIALSILDSIKTNEPGLNGNIRLQSYLLFYYSSIYARENRLLEADSCMSLLYSLVPEYRKNTHMLELEARIAVAYNRPEAFVQLRNYRGSLHSVSDSAYYYRLTATHALNNNDTGLYQKFRDSADFYSTKYLRGVYRQSLVKKELTMTQSRLSGSRR